MTDDKLLERRDASGRLQAVPLESRFWPKVDRRSPDECWPWTAHISSTGYGQIGIGNRKISNAHRVAYELTHGAVPEGMQLDHLCRNRACCNPAHLEPVTPRENTRRGVMVERRRETAAQITHCPKGHTYDAENTYVSKAGKRHCKRCQIDRQRARRAA